MSGCTRWTGFWNIFRSDRASDGNEVQSPLDAAGCRKRSTEPRITNADLDRQPTEEWSIRPDPWRAGQAFCSPMPMAAITVSTMRPANPRRCSARSAGAMPGASSSNWTTPRPQPARAQRWPKRCRSWQLVQHATLCQSASDRRRVGRVGVGGQACAERKEASGLCGLASWTDVPIFQRRRSNRVFRNGAYCRTSGLLVAMAPLAFHNRRGCLCVCHTVENICVSERLARPADGGPTACQFHRQPCVV